MPQNKTLGRPVSTEKVTIPNKACEILEEDVDLYTVFEFHNITSILANDIYLHAKNYTTEITRKVW